MKDPWKRLISNVKVSGRRGHEQELKEKSGSRPRYDIQITASDLKEIFEKQNKRCYWFNIEFDPNNLFVAHHPLAPSVDRLYNDTGYTKDNIVICSRMANLGRGVSSPQEFASIVSDVYTQAWKDPFHLNELQRNVSRRIIKELEQENKKNVNI